jgi:hypothetical protein
MATMASPGPLANDASSARETAALIAAIEAMEGTLAVAGALAAERRRIDLAGLDAEIGRICAASLVVPRQAAPDIRARLQALLRAHDRLRAGLAPP